MDRVALRRLLGFVFGLLLGAGWSLSYAWVWPEGAIIKAATDGTPVIAGRVVQGASVATGGGAAALRASQLLGLGSTAATLTLSRGVPAVMLASVGRVAAVAFGPVALAGLVLAQMNWNGVSWDAVESLPVPLDPVEGRWWRPDILTGVSSCLAFSDHCSMASAVSASLAVIRQSQPTWTNIHATGVVTLYAGSPSNPNSEVTYLAKYEYTVGTVVYSDSVFVRGSTVDPGWTAPVAGSRAATDAEVEAAVLNALQSNPSKAGEVLDQAIKHPQAALLLNPEAQQVSGPATVQGESETTVKQTDAGTETTTKTRQHNLQYQGNTVNVTTTTTNTTVHADNSTTTTTNTTNAAGGQAPPPPEVPDVCKENPTASGCAPFGSPADKVDLQEKTEQVTFAQEKSDGGTCPAPIPLSFVGKSFTFDYAFICDLAIGVRPLVLAISWLGAIAWVFRVSRGATA